MALKYKVGDYVRIKSLDWYNENKDNYGAVYAGNGFAFWNYMAGLCGEIMTISSIKVDPEDSNKGYYFMENSEEKWTDEMIEGLVEDKALKQYEVPTGSIKIWDLPNGYIFKDENDNVINATKIVLEKKKKEYPKTYEECCKVIDYALKGETIIGYKASLLRSLQKLLICRDAYWKIAGEEMGLGKPWKPNWTSFEGYPAIYMYRYQITLSVAKDVHHCLAFPTEEMRDAFYENFKKLIEQCKELL